MTIPRTLPALWQLSLLTLVYVGAGKLGLGMAFVHTSASAVWPPTGIAFAAFLLLGSRVWPAILLGAFLVNVMTAGSVATSIGIAIGNTLEGLLGADLVTRFAHGRRVFDRAQDVVKFLVLAGLFSTTVSATLGVTSLSLAGYATWTEYGSIWFTWWLGDAAGNLVFAPILVLWCTDRRVRWSRGQALESVLLLTALILVGRVVFGGFIAQPLTFLAIPPLVWAAFRFSQRETATATALLSAMAIWGTLRGVGPFISGTPNESLLLLQAFMGTMAMMSLSIASVVAERKRDEAALARLAAIVQSSDDAIVGKTLDGVIMSWNAGAERLYGYSAVDAIGRKVSILIPPDRPDELPEILDRLKRGEHVEPFKTARRRKDGTSVRVSVTMSPVRDSSGALLGASTIDRDIAQQERMEAELRDAAALRSVASLAVAAAHEINNPLTAVYGQAQLLAREADGKWYLPVATMIEGLERIRDIVARMSQITRLVPAAQSKNLPEMLDLRESSSGEAER